ncbi:hypothetical protein FGB62_107g010 [Gracilaria domingensis]|nr:hypothetical protein FGB62_107g010 [Gracilaria domingensis]
MRFSDIRVQQLMTTRAMLVMINLKGIKIAGRGASLVWAPRSQVKQNSWTAGDEFVLIGGGFGDGDCPVHD